MVSKATPKTVDADINWAAITDLAAAREALGNVVDVSELLGDGSTFYTDKSVFVGKPFLILDWRFIVDEKTNREYVNVLVMGPNGDKARFNDGSVGVYQQIKSIHEAHGKIGVQVKGGLRQSNYVKELEDGSRSDATTYYLSV